MQLIRRDPNNGYIDSVLWVPKAQVNVDGVKSALTFTVNDKKEFGGIRFLHLFRETTHHLLVPREFWEPKDLAFPVIDSRPTTFKKVAINSKITLDLKTPSETVQRDAVRAMQEARGGILQLACGKGKTVCALELAARTQVPTLIIVDNTHLMNQWQEAIGMFLDVPGGIGIIGDGQFDWQKSVVMATYQTLAQKVDLFTQEFRRWFGLVIWDECFASSATVDGISIREIKEGDLIRSFNHDTGDVELRRVLRKFARRPLKLVRVHLMNGASYVCTPNHPFFTTRGYAPAGSLQPHDAVGILTHHAAALMPLVRDLGTSGDKSSEGSVSSQRSGLLLEGARGDGTCCVLFPNGGRDQQEVCVRQNEGTQPHALRRSPAEDVEHATCHQAQAGSPWRKRSSIERSSTTTTGTPGVGSGACNPNGSWGESSGLRNALQDRHCKSGREDCNRDRWQHPSLAASTGERPQEGELLDFIGVDRVEVLEHGSDGRYGGLCPEGVVYNLEVEGNNNYFVDDILVHNCHHMAAPTWARTADLFYGKRIGLTATPERADGTHVIYDFHIGKVLYKDLVQELKPAIYFYWTGLEPDFSDLSVKSKTHSSSDELHLGMLAGYFGQWRERLDLILREVQTAERQGRRVLVLSYSIAELINLFTLWCGATDLYTDIKYPTAAEVGETVEPSSLTPQKLKNTFKRRAILQRVLSDPKVTDTYPVKMQLKEIDYLLKAHDVAKKCAAEYGKRQREFLKKVLADNSSNAGIMIGDIPAEKRMKTLREKKVVFSIMKYGREGLDEQSLDTVFVCEPMSQKNGLQQLMGRVLRKKAGKKTPVVVFFEDNVGPMIGMCTNLRRHLRGWPVDEGGPFDYHHVNHPTKEKERKTWATL